MTSSPPTQSVSPTPIQAPNGRCGIEFGGASCPNGDCCSQYGYCGTTSDHCSLGCQSNCGNVVNVINNCVKPNTVALTFDDGPSDFTNLLLDTLTKLKVKVSFFVLGSKAQTTNGRRTIQRASTLGHTIAVHTWSHPHLTQLTEDQVRKEILDTITIIKQATGKTPKYFRPPYLDYNARVDSIVKSFSLRTVWTNLDTFDWKFFDTNPSQILTNVANGLITGGSFITLQHDTLKASNDQIQQIVQLIQSRGFSIVSMDECVGSIV